jgi:ornithine cyclodeaminase/alanine dehydrogenase-like protein (mu-crystallin family)
LRRGVISREHVRGELADLVRGQALGRTGEREITLFKSVGCAMQDLAAAKLIMSAVEGAPGK